MQPHDLAIAHRHAVLQGRLEIPEADGPEEDRVVLGLHTLEQGDRLDVPVLVDHECQSALVLSVGLGQLRWSPRWHRLRYDDWTSHVRIVRAVRAPWLCRFRGS